MSLNCDDRCGLSSNQSGHGLHKKKRHVIHMESGVKADKIKAQIGQGPSSLGEQWFKSHTHITKKSKYVFACLLMSTKKIHNAILINLGIAYKAACRVGRFELKPEPACSELRSVQNFRWGRCMFKFLSFTEQGLLGCGKNFHRRPLSAQTVSLGLKKN